jgi:hypothetical protein
MEARIISNKEKIKTYYFNVPNTYFAQCFRIKGLLLVEFLFQGSTINGGVYCGTLKKLRHAIQNMRRDMFCRGVVMLHDYVSPHTAAAT